MLTKNISAKEARKIAKTTDHRPLRSLQFKPTEEDFPLFDGGHSDPISSEITQTPFENPKVTLTTLNGSSWRIVVR
jgi:hypothetical protein